MIANRVEAVLIGNIGNSVNSAILFIFIGVWTMDNKSWMLRAYILDLSLFMTGSAITERNTVTK